MTTLFSQITIRPGYADDHLALVRLAALDSAQVPAEPLLVAEMDGEMSAGTIEQVGDPREIYDRPATDFVMGFVGPVSRLGGKLVRPHDVIIALEPGDARIEAMVKRVVHLGFEVRLELELPDGSEARAQLTRAQADELELGRGDIVYARPPAGVPIVPELRGSVRGGRDSAEAEVPAAAFEEPV